MGTELYPYQTKAAARVSALLAKERGGFLWGKVGSGKTAAALTATARVRKGLLFVVAPKRVCMDVWPQEIRKWLGGDYPVVQLCGLTAASRGAALTDMSLDSIILVNYEMLPWLLERNLPAECMWIFDEVDKMKGYSAKRVRIWIKKRREGWSVLGMTGTPTPSHYLELWAQVACTAGVNPLPKTYNRYRMLYFHEPRPFRWTPFPGSVDSIRAMVLPHVVHMEPDVDLRPAVMELDPRVSHLPSDAKRAYRALERDYITEWNDETFDAMNAGVLWNKLRCFAQGALMSDGEVTAVHNEKLSALDELVSELQGSPMLVAFHYRWQAEALAKRGWPSIYGATDDKTASRLIAEWNAGEHEVMGVQPSAAGHGLNLQGCGAHHICFMTLPITAALKEQVIGRLRRVGSAAETVYVHSLETAGTVDEDARKMVGRKTVTQADLWLAAKERMRT